MSELAQNMQASVPTLEARRVSKTFGNQAVLDAVDFSLHAGEVHALLGENGAGKSTLIKILTGVYRQEEGEVLMNGNVVSFRDPHHAQEYGIGTVYQEVNLLPNRSVAENLMLGRQPRRFGFVQKREMERKAKELLAQYGLNVDVRAELGNFSVAVQQIVAIARAVEFSGKVLILDEPTASLDRKEVDRLFSILRGLRERGLAIVFITHFLDQVFALADRFTVLRNGKAVNSRALNDVSRTELVRMMLGKDIAYGGAQFAATGRPLGDSLVEFVGVGRHGHLKPFNLHIRKGEVIGVAGLLGSGRTSLARLMFGIDLADEGDVLATGAPWRIQSPAEAIRLGWGFCPEDRKADGIFGDLSVRENIVVALQGKLGTFSALSRDEQLEIAGKFVEQLDIRAASPDMPAKLLSGGNQQKVLLARWLVTDPTLLILDEPTRGIDIGAHAEIVRVINRLREDGLALVVISSELDEIVAYSSRVVVMRDREMVSELHGVEISPDIIVQAIASQDKAHA
jgi:galactofuranose transport system ATP-binding protein